MVEGEIQSRTCRFINGYGPQEAADINKRLNFYARLKEEIISTNMEGAMICLQLDANWGMK